MFNNEAERFCCPFYPTFKDLSLPGTNNNGSHKNGGRNPGGGTWKSANFFARFCFLRLVCLVTQSRSVAWWDKSRANEATEIPFSSPEPVFSWSRGLLQKKLSRALLASQLTFNSAL